ncbi:phosphoethanolamine transferase [Neptunicella sp.]|uniref:phosphoethanolamine transferase n=1 Tax=Neptunicella sp. TaxID=2125986 RepID=UPI003F692183
MSRFKFTQSIQPLWLIFLSCLYILVATNFTFYQQVNQVYPWNESFVFVLSLSVLVFCVIFLTTYLFNLFMPVKLAVSLMILIAVSSSYFADTFGTVIDNVMIRNTLETNIAEATDLFTVSLLLRLFLLAALPIALVWALPLTTSSIVTRVKRNVIALTLIILVVLANLFGFSDYYASFFREHKPLRYFINPVFPIYSSIKYINNQFGDNRPKTLIKSASYSRVAASDHHKKLVIVVVGETARTDRFSLNGYQRQTNPLLEQESNLISFTNISACGTSTAISVPCMFAIKGQQDFDVSASRYTENVLDLLANAGVSVLWRDNNSDSKGVADRVSFEDFRKPENNSICDDECRDVGMLNGLQDYIEQQSGDIVIVLHQMGSHGPAYFKRYPAEFEYFKPSCKTKELASCSIKEINNAYDNSIRYTDYFLSKVITLLKANTPKFKTAMLYISDHGESLGENGMYLHGMPLMFAPSEQLKVPIIGWFGDSSDVDLTATESIKGAANSHDAVSKTLLEMLEIETDAAISDAPALLIMKSKD